ncbi:3'-5' exonuclease [Gordonia rhizosphera]|uniref:Putative nuclease n=1 Tax=Gordonia rhizosphera NBRC 16068 TaxID=1108045 RepID=K6UZC8_9ACTN|nr:3'-5' exonuclease [Gordonia rhizosphera]GAB88833.1 putative nuclease [Gordonia rhizosphera NBRC 16068]
MRWRRRPSGRNLPWREVDYVAIDLETTGLDLKRDAIISYGAAVIRGGRIIVADNSYGLACPDSDISPQSIAVHTIRRVDVADAPSPEELARTLSDLIADRVVIAHSAWIERAFLDNALHRIGQRMRAPMIDTAALCRALGLDPDLIADPRLEWAANQLQVPVVSPHHAMGDATTTAHVFLAAASILEARGYTTGQSFIDLTAGDRHTRASGHRPN